MDESITDFVESNENLFRVILNTVNVIDAELYFIKSKEIEMHLIANGDIVSPFNYCKDADDFDEKINNYQDDLANIRRQMMRFYYSRNCIDKFLYITIPSLFKKFCGLFRKKSK